MINRIVLFILFALIAFLPIKAQIVVNGILPQCPGEKLRLILYNDYISFSERTFTTAQLDDQGRFSITIDTNKTIHAIFDVALFREQLVLEPGKTYFLKAPKFWIDETVNPRLSGQHIGFWPDSTDLLNPTLFKLNVDFSRFLDTSFVALYRRHNLQPLHAFNRYLDSTYLGKNPIVTSATKYRLASLQLSVGSVKRKEALSKFKVDSVQYADFEYMQFWNEYFDHFLTSKDANVSNLKLLALVNHTSSFLALSDSLRREPFLNSEELRNTVLLKALGEFFYKPAFDETNILLLLQDAEKVLPNKWQQTIANGILTKCKNLRRGTIPPALEANDLDGNRYALEQSKGKLVFLSFINSNCTACLSNLELLRTVYEQNRSDLEVVTIITDRDTLQANNLANILNYKWKVLISPQNYQLLDDYKVYGYPLELVLDRQGAIWQYPARSLEEHLIPLLTNLPANKTIRQGFQPIRKK